MASVKSKVKAGEPDGFAKKSLRLPKQIGKSISVPKLNPEQQAQRTASSFGCMQSMSQWQRKLLEIEVAKNEQLSQSLSLLKKKKPLKLLQMSHSSQGIAASGAMKRVRTNLQQMDGPGPGAYNVSK